VKQVLNAVVGLTEEATAEEEVVYNAEMVQEQEEEKEQQQEQEQEQEIEIEKYVDLAYSRENEEPTPWPFATLRNLQSAVQFYRANEFHLYKRKPLSFAEYLLVSNNYFDRRWSGARRIKNCVVALDWIPSLSELSERQVEGRKLSDEQEVALNKAFLFFDANNSGDIDKDEMAQIIRSVVDFRPTEEQVADAMTKYRSEEKKRTEYAEFRKFVLGGEYRTEDNGRYTTLVSLAEAETIHRIMHVRLVKSIIDNSVTSIALRCVAVGVLHPGFLAGLC